MSETPLHFKTISEIAGLIESKQLSPVEVTEAMLRRIESVDGQYKSYATVMGDSAMEAARAAEREIAAGRYLGQLHGVPIAVKDLCYTKGVRTMGGLKVLRDFAPDFDGTVVRKLASAGSVLLGKLNLTEGAMAGYNPEFDIPLNPWNTKCWAGASSSGSGAATAAGLCFGSLGSDTGGSIRFPSASCGIVGIKPTWGRVSRYGVLALAESLDHVGPMTRSAVDAGIMLQAIAGRDPNDPTTLGASVPNMLEGVGRGVEGIRIGLDEHWITQGADPQVTEAVLAGARVMEGLGAEIVQVSMPDTREYCPAWSVLCAAEALAAHQSNFHFPAGRVRTLVPGLFGQGHGGHRRRLRQRQQRESCLQRHYCRRIFQHRRAGVPFHAYPRLPRNAGGVVRPHGHRRPELVELHHALRLQRRSHDLLALRPE